jgi:hypothetical protein
MIMAYPNWVTHFERIVHPPLHVASAVLAPISLIKRIPPRSCLPAKMDASNTKS